MQWARPVCFVLFRCPTSEEDTYSNVPQAYRLLGRIMWGPWKSLTWPNRNPRIWGPKTAPIGPPDGPFGAPKRPRLGPETAQSKPETAPEGPIGAKTRHWPLSVPPKWPPSGPSWPQVGPRRPKFPQVGRKMGPRWAQVGPKMAQHGLQKAALRLTRAN